MFRLLQEGHQQQAVSYGWFLLCRYGDRIGGFILDSFWIHLEFILDSSWINSWLKYMQCQYFPKIQLLLKKIRIGYVLKSADVGTLFSGRNSENSSHTHVHTHAHPTTHDNTRPHPRWPACAHPHTTLYTRTHSHTPHTYPLMPLTWQITWNYM